MDVGYCLQSAMMLLLPSHPDLYVVGFPCKGFSISNSKCKCLQAPHAATLHGVVGFAKSHIPAGACSRYNEQEKKAKCQAARS